MWLSATAPLHFGRTPFLQHLDTKVEDSGGRRTPPVKPRIAEATPRAYRKTRIEAANETGLKENEFPRGVSIQLERYRQPRICALRNLAVAFRLALPVHSEMTAQHHSVD
jgi:hypothetical protein